MQADFLEYYNAIQRGQKLLELKRPSEALVVFQEALHISADFFLAYEGMAMSYRELGRYTSAQDCIKKGLSVAPNQASLYFQQGLLFHEQEKHKEAVKSLEQAVKLQPDDEDYQVALAATLEGRGSFKDVLKASRLLEKSLKSNPESVPALRKIAIASLEVNRYLEAKLYADRLAQIDPNDPVVIAINAELDQQQGKGDLAREQYQAVLREQPDSTFVLYQYYDTYSYRNRLWRTITRFIPVQMRNPVIAAAATFVAAILILILITKTGGWLDEQVGRVMGVIFYLPILIYWVARVPGKWLRIWRDRPYPWGWRERSFIFLDLSGAIAAISLLIFFITMYELYGTTAFFLFLYSIYLAALIFSVPIPYQRLAIAVLAVIYFSGIVNFIAVVLGHRPPRITDLIAGLSWIALIFLIQFFFWLHKRTQEKSSNL